MRVDLEIVSARGFDDAAWLYAQHEVHLPEGWRADDTAAAPRGDADGDGRRDLPEDPGLLDSAVRKPRGCAVRRGRTTTAANAPARPAARAV